MTKQNNWESPPINPSRWPDPDRLDVTGGLTKGSTENTRLRHFVANCLSVWSRRHYQLGGTQRGIITLIRNEQKRFYDDPHYRELEPILPPPLLVTRPWEKNGIMDPDAGTVLVEVINNVIVPFRRPKP